MSTMLVELVKHDVQNALFEALQVLQGYSHLREGIKFVEAISIR